MKKTLSLFGIALLAIVTTTFTSCKKPELDKGGGTSTDSGEAGNIVKQPQVQPPRPKGPRKVEFVIKKVLQFDSLIHQEFDKSGEHLLVSDRKSVKYYNLSDGQLIFEPPVSSEPATLSPDGRYLYTSWKSGHPMGAGRIKVYDLQTGKQVGQLETKEKEMNYKKLCFSSDGRYLFAFCINKRRFGYYELHKWDVVNKTLVWKKTSRINCGKLYCDSQDQWLLLLPSGHKCAQVLNPVDGEILQEFGGDRYYGNLRNKLVTMEKSGKNNQLPGHIELYEAGSWDLLVEGKIEGPFHEGKQQGTSWQPWPEKRLVIGKSSRSIVFRDVKTLKVVGEITPAPAPDKWFGAVAVSPDGETLIIDTENRTFIGTIVEK